MVCHFSFNVEAYPIPWSFFQIEHLKTVFSNLADLEPYTTTLFNLIITRQWIIRKRVSLKNKMQRLVVEIEKKFDQTQDSLRVMIEYHVISETSI